MLLDQLRPTTQEELVKNVKLLFDHTATGEEVILLERMAESQVAIALELCEVLSFAHSPDEAWDAILKVLRLLPWNIDPETASYPSLYRYFGGLENYSCEDESLFNSLAHMMDSEHCWPSVVNYVSQNLKVNP